MSEPTSFDRLPLSADEASKFCNGLGDERLLTREQVAQLLNVSARTVAYWCANARATGRRKARAGAGASRAAIRPSRERLPYIKLGHKVFFMLGDVRKFRDERKVNG
jgi:hypothetical protein